MTIARPRLVLLFFFAAPFLVVSQGDTSSALDPGVTIEELANTPASAPETDADNAPAPAPVEAPRWTAALPEDLLRPTRAAPVYPRDGVIGELGAGAADEAAYRFAHSLLAGLLAAKEKDTLLRALPEAERAAVWDKIAQVEPRKYRLGGGLVEPDGSVSFLYRITGREKEVSGSLYMLPADGGRHTLDSILMEEVVETSAVKEIWDYAYLPYARFY
ncbi:MAG: hypothetical protein LBG74_04595 [Spirochaetaceae bacterium]|nr:hypothetical protein [Spirochaetaceae bacterium]